MKQFFKSIIVFIITLEARLVLKKYKPKIVAVTGSVGKTSSKDAIATVLGCKFKVKKSQKSYNSEVGAPLTVLDCESGWLDPFKWFVNILKGFKLIFFKNDYAEWLVLELGVERPKDMEKLVGWIKPHIAVITALSDIPVHVEFFASPEALAKEKTKILKNLGVNDFTILNSDDETVYELKNKTNSKIITFGFGGVSDIKATNYQVSLKGLTFKAEHNGNIIPVRLFNAFGRHHVYPALAGLAVGKVVGLNFIESSEALLSYEPAAGRLKLIEGVKKSFILDDTYNSSPVALRAALDTLKDMEAKRKIAVLGDMLELGKYTIEVHRSLAEDIILAGVETVFIVGPRAKFIAEGLREKNFPQRNIFEFPNSDIAQKEVEKIIEEGDLILVKGSQSMRMERIVEEIMAHPEKKSELLVRQEKEWLDKK